MRQPGPVHGFDPTEWTTVATALFLLAFALTMHFIV
jgi:hypothetical protein